MKAVQFGQAHVDEFEGIKHIENLIFIHTSLDAVITTSDHRDTNINIVKNYVWINDSHKNWNALLYEEALKIKELKPILYNIWKPPQN